VRVNCGEPRGSRAEKPIRESAIDLFARSRAGKCDDHPLSRRKSIEDDVEEGGEEVTEEGERQAGPQDGLQRGGERERAAAESEGMQASETGSRCEAENRILMRLAKAKFLIRGVIVNDVSFCQPSKLSAKRSLVFPNVLRRFEN